MVDDRHTPIVAMTANAMPKDQEDCLAAGMDDYLAKPVKTAQIVAMLERWITLPTLAGLAPRSVQERPDPGADSP
jgi:CheY-like chemotaxis protein